MYSPRSATTAGPNLRGLVRVGLALIEQGPTDGLLFRGAVFGHDSDEIRSRFERSRRRLAQLDPINPQFEWHDVEVLPPGSFDPRVLDQGVVWVDEFRNMHRVTWLSDEHLVAVVAHLTFLQGLNEAWKGYARVHRIETTEPPSEAWLDLTPLFLALTIERMRRGL